MTGTTKTPWAPGTTVEHFRPAREAVQPAECRKTTKVCWVRDGAASYNASGNHGRGTCRGCGGKPLMRAALHAAIHVRLVETAP
jgi:hypothetical protein